MKKVAMHQVLGQHNMKLKFGAGQHEGAVGGDTAGDGVEERDRDRDRERERETETETETETEGTGSLARLSVVTDNPHAWPDISGVSEPCRKLVLSNRFDQFIGAPH